MDVQEFVSDEGRIRERARNVDTYLGAVDKGTIREMLRTLIREVLVRPKLVLKWPKTEHGNSQWNSSTGSNPDHFILHSGATVPYGAALKAGSQEPRRHL